jgi:hypothetical protein
VNEYAFVALGLGLVDLALLGTIVCLIVEMRYRRKSDMTMQSWAGRMAAERYDLLHRLTLLENFLHTPEFETLPKIECDDLITQFGHMNQYLVVLQRRYDRL